MSVYYNEIDNYDADWIENLYESGAIAPGIVDRRDIREVNGNDVEHYSRCHFFAGIGGWDYALQLAGWPTTLPVWTGSCPCQPFSTAGKRLGTADERHLWPEFRRLIGECQPAIVVGEQVAESDGLEWLAGIQTDLERMAYAVGACDLPAACVAANQERQRLFWFALRMGGTEGKRPQGRADESVAPTRQRENARRSTGFSGPVALFPNGKRRRLPDTESGIQPLAYGIPQGVGRLLAGVSGVDRNSIRAARHNRVGRIKGYGNAIVPQVAAVFLRAVLEIVTE